MYVCMYVCMYAMYVCMYIYMYTKVSSYIAQYPACRTDQSTLHFTLSNIHIIFEVVCTIFSCNMLQTRGIVVSQINITPESSYRVHFSGI